MSGKICPEKFTCSHHQGEGFDYCNDTSLLCKAIHIYKYTGNVWRKAASGDYFSAEVHKCEHCQATLERKWDLQS